MVKAIAKACNSAGNTKVFKAVENVATSPIVQKVLNAALVASIAAQNVVGYAGSSGLDIDNMLRKVITMIYGFLWFAGTISIIIGIVNIAGAMGEEGGQDAQKMSKGKGAIIRGGVMVAIPSVLSILGINAESITIK